MKYIYFQITLLVLFAIALTDCQAQNEIDITAQTCHRRFIVDGQIKEKRWVIEQKTYNTKSQLLRNIVFDTTTMNQIREYIIYFYNSDDKLELIECFNNSDSIRYGVKYLYDIFGNNIEQHYYRPENGNLKVYEKIINNIADGKIITSKTLNQKNKAVIKESFHYNTSGKPVLHEMKFKKHANPEQLRKKAISFTYAADGKLSRKQTDYLFYTKERNSEIIDYTYNGNGKLMKTVARNSTSSEVVNTEYLYNEFNLVSYKRILDEAGTLIDLYQYDYKNRTINFGTYKRLEIE